MTIRYEIVSGELPAGLSLQETTGRILGDIDFSNLDPGPGVRYSFDGGQSWAASFPRNLADTANVSSFTDVAIMG